MFEFFRLVDNSGAWVLFSGAYLEDAGLGLRDDLPGAVSDVFRGVFATVDGVGETPREYVLRSYRAQPCGRFATA